MAHTNQTLNYSLSQFDGTDKPAWLVDYNGDMEKIDLGLKDAKDVADAAKEEADQGAIDIAAVTVTANSADAKASGAISDLSDEYDATSTYNAGDYVIYNNILYKCIVNITVPESFDGNHWARTTVEEMFEELNIALDQLNNKILELKYQAGDVLILNEDYFYGHAGSSRTNILFVLTTNKEIPIELNESVSLSHINLVANGTFTQINMSQYPHTITTTKKQSEITVLVTFTGTTPIPSSANDTACVVRATGTVSFS